jgi:hypothetical protein
VLGVLLRPAARCGGGQRGGGRLALQQDFRSRFYARGRNARSHFSSPQAREAVEIPSQWQARLRCSYARVTENLETFSTRRSGPLLCDISLADKLVRLCWVLLMSRWHSTDGVREVTGNCKAPNVRRLRAILSCASPHEQAPRSRGACPPTKRPSGMCHKYPPIYLHSESKMPPNDYRHADRIFLIRYANPLGR